MVIDSAAVVALLANEPDQARIAEAIEAADAPLLFIGDDFSCTDIVSVLDNPRPIPRPL